MTCCERTLVVLACVAGLLKENQPPDEAEFVLKQHMQEGELCAACEEAVKDAIDQARPWGAVGAGVAVIGRCFRGALKRIS